jgi:Ca2+-binding RTX toxin-like protein
VATFTFLNTSNGTFAGTAGDDVFIWPTTNGSIDSGDTFFGGAGNDTLRLDSAVSLNFSGASASQWMAGIERITVNNTGVGNSITIGATAGAPEGGVITMLGGVGNDVFNIAARAVGYNGIFESAGGNDLFLGGGGADTFRPGTGNDTFSGGGGPDMVEFAQSSLLGTQPFNGADSLIGGSGLDTLRFTGDAAQGVVLTVYLQAPLIESFEVIDLTGYSGPSNVAMFSSYTANGDVTVLGGTGGDTVFGGSSVATRFVSVFEGGAGNDLYETITGTNLFRPGSGADSLRGGDGADAVEMAVADLDLLDSFTVDPAGFGVVRFTAGGVLTQVLANRLTGFERLELGPAGVAITLQGLPAMSGPDAALAVYDFVPVFGGTGRDRIDATPLGTAPVVIHGGADNDTITGTTFVLTMNGGEKSTDTLHGDDGNDLILGGAGRDSISGGAGNDTIDGGAGNEGDGTGLFNLLSGGGGNDRILLGAGNDWFILDDLESGQDSVFGGIGDDIIDIASGSQIGDDLLAGGTGADTLLAFYINDPLILGATATDRFSGFESILLPGYAATSLVITDSLAETAETPLQIVSTPVGARTLMLDASTVTDTGIVIFRADDIAVPNALTADTLIGGGGADTMTRFGGADLVMTGGGDDLVITPFPGAAPDPAKLDGGAGIDTLRALGAISSAGLSFATLTGFEIIELAGDGPNAISFVAGGLPAGGAVEIRGGSDADILDASALATGARFLGRAGDDILTGGSAADLLDAGVGADLVVGGGGNDTVHFADWAGDDIADGGTGIDRLDLSLGNALVPAGLLTSFAGFEALTLDMAGARVVLPGTFATTVGTGVFTVDLNTTAGAPGSAFRAQAVSNRLDIFGDAGMEAILGGRGADTIRDGGSADRIQGHLGADRIVLSDDGAADRVAFGNFFDGSFDIAAPANQGTLAQADTVIGFAGAGDPDNVLEFTRAAFGGLGAKSVVTTLAAGANLDLSTSGAFIVNAAHPVAGSFADRAAINTAFASKVLGGDAGNGAFVIARGPGGTDAAVYYIGDLDNLPGLSDQDLLVLLAVLVAPGAITANEILLA